jgi:hypothetical protein
MFNSLLNSVNTIIDSSIDGSVAVDAISSMPSDKLLDLLDVGDQPSRMNSSTEIRTSSLSSTAPIALSTPTVAAKVASTPIKSRSTSAGAEGRDRIVDSSTPSSSANKRENSNDDWFQLSEQAQQAQRSSAKGAMLPRVSSVGEPQSPTITPTKPRRALVSSSVTPNVSPIVPHVPDTSHTKMQQLTNEIRDLKAELKSHQSNADAYRRRAEDHERALRQATDQLQQLQSQSSTAEANARSRIAELERVVRDAALKTAAALSERDAALATGIFMMHVFMVTCLHHIVACDMCSQPIARAAICKHHTTSSHSCARAQSARQARLASALRLRLRALANCKLDWTRWLASCQH